MKNNSFAKDVSNEMKLTLPSLSVNEGLARAVVAAFTSQLDPAAPELADVKCAVSEAVTNCIVHAYHDCVGMIYMVLRVVRDRTVRIEIRDHGCGIPDVSAARQPLFTTDAAGERSGMGFTVMESFMDKLTVRSKPGRGTTVVMYKTIGGKGA